MPPIIEVRDLTKRYKGAETNAVDGVSFDVAPGEFFALLGPNGAGKATTILILTTTLAPTGGTVRIAGHDLATEAAAGALWAIGARSASSSSARAST